MRSVETLEVFGGGLYVTAAKVAVIRKVLQPNRGSGVHLDGGRGGGR